MKTKLDSRNAEALAPLTDARREHLAELAALPDESIDTSDIPELSDEAWSAGVRLPLALTPTCWIGSSRRGGATRAA
jgi:hypothetical protein